MSGAFRFTKSIAASLLLAIVAFALQYGESFLVRDVENLSSATQPGTDLLAGQKSQSSQRTSKQLTEGDAVNWNIGVVTNRLLNGRPTETRDAEERRDSLMDQVKEAMYATPVTTYGLSNVRLPGNRKRGDCKTRSSDRPRIEVGPLAPFDRQNFLQHVSDSVTANSGDDVLVFVHGFNVSLENATARAAQIAEDMPFHGSMIAFSWQSAGNSAAYLSDEVLAERFFWNLAKLLADLRTACPNARLHVLAHSMGNRVALRAIESLCGTIAPTGHRDSLSFERFFRQTKAQAETGFASVVSNSPAEIKRRFPEWGAWRGVGVNRSSQIDTLIMAAPDVGVSEFQLAVANIQPVCKKMILYASDTDYALHASKKVHGGYRAGDSRAEMKLKALTRIKVTGVDTADPLGHSYYGSNSKVLTQLSMLLNPPRTQVAWSASAVTNN